ncbi:hypothetical protein Peur_010420 [Populus x canadensis]
MIGAFGFLYAAQNQGKSMVDPGYPTGIGMKNALIVLGVINVFGFLLTFLVPGPKGRCLEEISGGREEVDQHIPLELKLSSANVRALTLLIVRRLRYVAGGKNHNINKNIAVQEGPVRKSSDGGG